MIRRRKMKTKLHLILITVLSLLWLILSAGGGALAAPAGELPILVGDLWCYFKGRSEPPSNWNDIGFDDSAWVEGPTGIGYSDDVTYPTILADMQGGYASFYVRRIFNIPDPSSIVAFEFGVRYDDGFIAYINGQEIARSSNMTQSSYAHNEFVDSSHDEEAPEEVFLINAADVPSLVAGENVLAIQVHNVTSTSSDACIVPRLIGIGNLPPTAVINADNTRADEPPLTVNFSGVDSTDNGTIVDYEWDFGDGSTVESGPESTTTHTYTSEGVFEATLTVTDDGSLTDTDSVIIVIGPTRTIYVDNNISGVVDASGDCIGTYDPGTRSGGSGSETAYNTFMEASLAVVAGDTIAIRGGTYNEILRPQTSGGPGNPVTYKNYDGEEVIIRDTPGLSNLTPDEIAPDDQLGRQYGIYIYDKSYIVIEGLHVTNVSGWARIVKSEHITFRNNTFTVALAHGTTGSVKFQHSDYNRFINNTMDDGNDNLLLIHSDHNLVERNHITKGRHTLWCIRAGNFNVIRNNYFHNASQKIGEIYDNEHPNHPPVIYNATKHNLVENNTFAYTPPPPVSDPTAGPYNGIQFAGQECIIRRNIFHDNEGGGIDLTLYSDESMYNTDNRIYNNVFYNNHYGGVAISSNRTYTFYGNILKNNIIYQNDFIDYERRLPELDGRPVQVVTYRTSSDYLFDGNNIFNSAAGESYIIATRSLSYWQTNYPDIFTLNNIEKEPMFVSIDTGYDPTLPEAANHDFTLTEGSPMIDAGTYLTTTTRAGSGTEMPVSDAKYFYDGYGIAGEAGDTIQLEGQTTRARIVNINYETDTLTLNQSLTWTAGQGVSLAYSGNGPDIGAYEYTLLPVAVIQNEPKQGYAPLTVSFDGSQSKSPHGDIVSYEWDFGDGASSQGKQILHTYTSPGEYTVTLKVTDIQGYKGKAQTHIVVFKKEKEFGELPPGCYNNVFNPTKGEKALIVVELQKQAYVRINLYNTRGNKIRELVDEEKEAGTHKYYWDGKDDSGNVVGSGLYFVHIQAGDYKKTKKIVVIK